MKVFIITYPEHARLSQLSAFFARKNLLGVSEVIYIWDDFHPAGKDHPFKSEKVVNFSFFKYTDTAPNGWFRQQFVKLQLHHLTSDEQFYVLDGDTLVRNPIDLRPNKMIKAYEYHKPYFDFIEEKLGLQKTNDFSFISPLLRFDRDVLVKLEDYAGTSIPELFLQYATNVEPYLNFSEAEIYGTFATQYLNKQYEYVPYTFNECDQFKRGGYTFEELYFSTNLDLVWTGSEKLLSDYFWEQVTQNSLQ